MHQISQTTGALIATLGISYAELFTLGVFLTISGMRTVDFILSQRTIVLTIANMLLMNTNSEKQILFRYKTIVTTKTYASYFKFVMFFLAGHRN